MSYRLSSRPILTALLFAAGCDGCCEDIPDPGNCWVEIGALEGVTTLGRDDGTLMAGDAAGEVHCLSGSSWVSANLAAGRPVDWLSTKSWGPALAAVDLGGTDAALFVGDCSSGWNEVQPSTFSGRLIDAHADDLGVAVSLHDGTVWFSADHGQTFTQISTFFPPWLFAAQVRVDGVGRVFVRDDHDDVHVWDGLAWASWTAAPLFGDLAVSPGDAALIFDGGSVARSDDGVSWGVGAAAASGQFAGLTFDRAMLGPARAWSARTNGLVRATTNDGASFDPYMECYPRSGLPTSAVTDIDMDEDTLLYLSTAAGVYRENGNWGSPCYMDTLECFPICPFGRVAGEPDPGLDHTAWADGRVRPVAAGGGEGVTRSGALVGSLTASNADSTVEVPVTGELSWTAETCDHEVCPLVVEGLSAQLDGAAADLGAGLVVEQVFATLTTPAVGGWRPDTGEILLAGPSVTGAVQVGWGGWGDWVLPADASGSLVEPLRGSVDERGLTLASTMVVDGVTFSLTLSTK